MPDPGRAIRIRAGRAIRRYRLAQRLSQERLAELTGLSGKHVGVIERGDSNVGLDQLARLAAALSVDVVVLLYPPRGRQRGDEAHFIARADIDTLDAIVRRVKGQRTRRPPRVAE